jgi:hypothetical protein
MDTYITFNEALNNRDFFNYNNAIVKLIELSNTETFLQNLFDESQNKAANEFMDYQNPERMVSYPPGNDRTVPLDAVTIEAFKQDHNKDIGDHVVIRYGPGADEYTRMHNALAIAVGTGIFFRNGAYKPETEEGRALLAHELTHVAQHTQGRVKGASSVELEREAIQAENAVKNENPYITISAGGELFKIKKTRIKELAYSVADDIQRHIESEKYHLSGQDYLKLLIAYEKWLKERY